MRCAACIAVLLAGCGHDETGGDPDAAARHDSGGSGDSGGDSDADADADPDAGGSCVPSTCRQLAPACGNLTDGCGASLQCDCPPSDHGTCVSDGSTRITTGWFEIATPFGDCFAAPRMCVPGADAWRLVRTVTLENDFIRITVADGGGGKVLDFRRKVDLERDRPDWDPDGDGLPAAPATTAADPEAIDPRYPPDPAGRGWLLRGGPSVATGCDGRPTNEDDSCSVVGAVESTLQNELPCTPRCDWDLLWGDFTEDWYGEARHDLDELGLSWPFGLERGTPHFVHNTIGTGTQFSVALRDGDETKDACLLMDNWNPNSNGSCDGTQNGGCFVTAAPDCAYGIPGCDETPLGDDCDLDRDRWTDQPIVSLERGPFRLPDTSPPADDCDFEADPRCNEALSHPPAAAPTPEQVGAHRLFLTTGMWRSFGGPVVVDPALIPDPRHDDCREFELDAGCPGAEGDDSTGWAQYCCPEWYPPPDAGHGYVGPQYWNNSFPWRVHIAGPQCLDAKLDECETCDPDLDSCSCCPGGFSADRRGELFGIDPAGFAIRATGCEAGESLCNGWPKEQGWRRPYPDEGANREDIWAQMYICLQGPEAIFQLRLHHPADPSRHGGGHPKPAHAIPQAHLRGVFPQVVYGDQGETRTERMPRTDSDVGGPFKRLEDAASENWIGLRDPEEIYGVFLYQDLDLGVDERGHSYGRIEELSARPDDLEGDKVKLATFSTRFDTTDSVLDLEYRYVFATPEYMLAHARCYNLGLPYPCGLELPLIASDGPELHTWFNGATGIAWSRVGGPDDPPADACSDDDLTEPTSDCWRLFDYTARILPMHDHRPEGTADVFECAAGALHVLAACPAESPDCAGLDAPAPCPPDFVRRGEPRGRVLLQQGLEGRTLWNLNVDDLPELRDGEAIWVDTFNPQFKPEWSCTAEDVDRRDCEVAGDRLGYDPVRHGIPLGYAPPGPTLSLWDVDGVLVAATSAPEEAAVHVSDLGMLFGSAPRYHVNHGFAPALPRRGRRPAAHAVFLCTDAVSGETFLSASIACDAAGADAEATGWLGLALDQPLEDHHLPGIAQTVEVVRCHRVAAGWSAAAVAEAGAEAACAALGVDWVLDASIGHLARFVPGGPPDGIEPR